MSLKASSPISAQAILKSPATAPAAAAQLAALGFEVGNTVGNSFSVSAPVRVFESVFEVRLRSTKKGGVGAGGTLELPLGSLPDALRSLLSAVTFTAPPDFGPTSW